MLTGQKVLPHLICPMKGILMVVAQFWSQMSDARASLAKFAEMKNSKATEDAWGVFLLGVPFSKLLGDSEANVAKYKGIIEAIET